MKDLKLYKISELKKFLEKNKLFAKKKLGQNFLIDKNILNLIIKSSDIKETDTIVEIGPGLGTLTSELSKHAKKVVSIEKDSVLAEILKKNFKDTNVEIQNQDALEFKPNLKKYKIVANIPYYISSPLISHYLTTKNPPETMTLLVQKEIAQRICAKEKHSILSLNVQLFANPKYIKTISKNSFYPIPKVYSAIIQLKRLLPPIKNNPKILKLAKIGFSQKRKLLIKTLKNALKIEEEKIQKIFLHLQINSKIRPEKMSIKDWRNLYAELFQQ